MESEPLSNFVLGIISGVITSYLIFLFQAFIYKKLIMRWKYRRFTGSYRHGRGTVDLIHTRGDFFQAIGNDGSGIVWKSNLTYTGNRMFSGVYDYQSSSNSNDWGEHHLHILDNGNIFVIWKNQSEDRETKGRLIWEKVG